jgi:hypothetical protein
MKGVLSQSRKDAKKILEVFFASLRLCGKPGLGTSSEHCALIIPALK